MRNPLRLRSLTSVQTGEASHPSLSFGHSMQDALTRFQNLPPTQSSLLANPVLSGLQGGAWCRNQARTGNEIPRTAGSTCETSKKRSRSGTYHAIFQGHVQNQRATLSLVWRNAAPPDLQYLGIYLSYNMIFPCTSRSDLQQSMSEPPQRWEQHFGRAIFEL